MTPTWARSAAHETKYQAGDLTIFPARRVVTRDGEEIPLGGLTYDLLLLLVDAAPKLVTPAEITQCLWAGRIVTEETIRQRIKLLRKALVDNSSNPIYLNVIRGQGYRFIPEVRRLTNESQGVLVRRPMARYLVAAGVVLVATAVTFWIRTPGNEAIPVSADNTIAVLPFEALTSDPQDRFFVDGFHNDLLTHLARIDDLSVISRTSVVEYRNEAKNLRKIGQELGAATILEGSIQRSGDKVRINAQLIDARNDRHLWAEVFDREVTAENLFNIQSEMASAITLALQIELSPSDSDIARAAPTQNDKAYNYYLLGLHYVEEPGGLGSFAKAAQAFEQAVTEDSDFALAWASLARAHSALFFFDDHTEARRDKSRRALDRALSLEPDLPEAHLAQGYFLYHMERDYDAALLAWQVAERGMPGDPRVLEARATVYARMGDTSLAVDSLEMSIRLDPRNVGKLVTLAWHLSRAGDYSRAEAVLGRVLRLAPDNPIGYRRLSFIPLWQEGDAIGMRAVLDAAPMPIRVPAMEWLASIYEREFDSAIAMLDTWNIDAVDTPIVYRPKSWFYGTTHRLAGNFDLASKHFHSAGDHVEQLVEERPLDLRLKITLADIKANLGEREAAIELAEHVLLTLPTTLDASLGPNFRLYAVKTLLAAGDHEAAISQLETYLSEPSVWTIDGLLPDPRLDPIRNDPRFVELVKQFSQSGVRLARLR